MDGGDNSPAADVVRQRCEACIKTRDLEGALAAGRELAELTPRDHQAWRLYAKAASLQPGFSAEIKVLKRWIALCPTASEPALRLAKRQLADHDLEGAEASFQLACENGLAEKWQVQFRQEVHWRQRDWTALSVMSPQIENWNGPVEDAPWLRVAIARFMRGDKVGGLQAIDHYMTGNPEELSFIPFVMRKLIAADRPGFMTAVLNRLRRAGIDEPDLAHANSVLTYLYPDHSMKDGPDELPNTPINPSYGSDVAAWLDDTLRLKFEVEDTGTFDLDTDGLAAALQASLDGDYDGALKQFDASLKLDWPPNALARITEMRSMLDRLAQSGAPGRAIIDPAVEDIVVSESLGTGRLAVVFTGIGNKVSGMPLTFFDRILAANGYQAIYLRDMSRCLFAAGIRSMGGTAQATLAALRTLIDGLEHDHLITLGVSAGGYAGLRYGLELEADRVFAFSPLTVIETEVRKQLGDERLPALGHAIQRRVTDEDFFSPVWEVLARRPYTSQVDIFATEGSVPDTGHARKMIGSPGVTVHMIGGSDRHDCLMTALTDYPDLLAPETEAGRLADSMSPIPKAS